MFPRGLPKILRKHSCKFVSISLLSFSWFFYKYTKIEYCGFGFITNFTMNFPETRFPKGMTLFTTSQSTYSNRQTVNPIAAVGLMCRLFSDNISSLFSIDKWLCVLITNNILFDR